MNSNLRNRLLVAAVLATTAPLMFASTAALAQAHGQQEQKPGKDKEKAKRAEAEQGRAQAELARQKAANDRQQANAQQQEARQHQQAATQHERQADAAGSPAVRQGHDNAAQAERQAQARAQAQANAHRAAANAAENKAARDQGRADREVAQPQAKDKPVQRQQAQAANQQARSQQQSTRRLAKAEQDKLITQQRSRVASFRNWEGTQRAESQRMAAAVQAQKRNAQYAYITDYNKRLFAQQQRYSSMNFDYYNDPYFYSAPSYRYQRGGSWYTINHYGVNLLQTAVNDGYGEGYHSGRADRMDGWRADYRNNWVYQNASYGYNGYYLDRSEYSYYFREGFRRGYEDGYYSRYQYGRYSNGNYSMVGAVLTTILGLQSYDYRN